MRKVMTDPEFTPQQRGIFKKIAELPAHLALAIAAQTYHDTKAMARAQIPSQRT